MEYTGQNRCAESSEGGESLYEGSPTRRGPEDGSPTHRDPEDGSPTRRGPEDGSGGAIVKECIYRHPRHRELLYKTLVFCSVERSLTEVEDYLMDQPESSYALQSPFTLIKALIDCGGLSYRDEDAPDDIPEELDRTRLPFRIQAVVTSDAGREAALASAPEQRIAACLAGHPAEAGAFAALLEFCMHPRSLEEIKRHHLLIASALQEGPHHNQVRASFFIDRLQEAGGLVWDGAWNTTEAGKRFAGTHYGKAAAHAVSS